MSLEFRGIPVNEHAHPGEPLLEELNTKTIYRLNEVIDTPVEIDKIKWIISYDRMGELIFNW